MLGLYEYCDGGSGFIQPPTNRTTPVAGFMADFGEHLPLKVKRGGVGPAEVGMAWVWARALTWDWARALAWGLALTLTKVSVLTKVANGVME